MTTGDISKNGKIVLDKYTECIRNEMTKFSEAFDEYSDHTSYQPDKYSPGYIKIKNSGLDNINSRTPLTGTANKISEDLSFKYFRGIAQAYLNSLSTDVTFEEASSDLFLDKILSTPYEEANECLRVILKLRDPKSDLKRGLSILKYDKNQGKTGA